MSQEKKWTLKDLINNLKNNKDAVVIFGDKALKDLELFNIDEKSSEFFSRKLLVKKPEKFWQDYQDLILNKNEVSSTEKALSEFLKLGYIKTIINLNYKNDLQIPKDVELVKLKGDKNELRCMSCMKHYTIDKDTFNDAKYPLKCDCNGKIVPTLVMYKEKYLQSNLTKVNDSIFCNEDKEKPTLNTHCLIFIGVDFEEDYIHDIIESYKYVKMQDYINDDNPYFIVMINNQDEVSIEYYEPEFATSSDIASSITRLIENIKNDNE